MTITKVTDGVYRGSQPVLIEDWAALASLGIKYALDLETGARLLSDGMPLEESLTAERYGIKSYAHPLGEILPPTEEELALACGFITYHQPVYVHCKAGVDRTGMVIATFRQANGMTRANAIKEMKQMKMHWWYYFWAWFL